MNGRQPDRAAPRIIEAEERQFRALELRKGGMSYRAIGKAMGVSYSAAHVYVVEALAELRAKTLSSAEHLRDLEIERLDRLEAKLQKGLRSADMTERAKVAVAIVKISESRRKLQGLDAPQKVEVSGNHYTVKEASPACAAWDEPMPLPQPAPPDLDE